MNNDEKSMCAVVYIDNLAYARGLFDLHHITVVDDSRGGKKVRITEPSDIVTAEKMATKIRSAARRYCPDPKVSVEEVSDG